MLANLESNIRYWESPIRYYQVRFYQNKNGEWVVVHVWGGKFNQRGGEKIEEFRTLDEVWERLDKLNKRRQQRGYRLLH